MYFKRPTSPLQRPVYGGVSLRRRCFACFYRFSCLKYFAFSNALCLLEMPYFNEVLFLLDILCFLDVLSLQPMSSSRKSGGVRKSRSDSSIVP